MKLRSTISVLVAAFFFCTAIVLPMAPAQDDVVPAADAKKQLAAKKSEDGLDASTFRAFKGLFDFYWDDKSGKLWLRLDNNLDKPFLYVTSLATGLGSNPVGLDRGQLGSTRMVRFIKIGPSVYLEQLNLKFRASSTNAAERNAVADSFANSVIWSTPTRNSANGQLLADITELIVRDAHQSASKLSSTGQGTYSFDKKRSFPYLPRTKAFPKNCEFEAAITLTSSKPGPLARRTAATGNSITLRQHHSFVKLPDDKYRPRKFDPRCGSFSVSFQDYSVPINENIEKRFLTRHRLIKKNPGAEVSEVEDPIVYYVDSGVPSPIKEALIEGASWWDDAFQQAGFKNAFIVKKLPDDADPMDVRFNVIQWVHRATRGWSYGQSVIDPRTGEIIKGHVLLGSLRVRQDLTLMNGFRGLRDGGEELLQDSRGNCSSCQAISPAPLPLTRLLSNDKGMATALARIRQLSAHEVGHTLGFAHNFAASTYGDRASVMDYPAPRTKLVGGKIDLADAYGVGIGIWDRFAVKYAYSEFASEEQEREGLSLLMAEAIKNKLRYVSDSDSRPAGAAHPYSSLWDNGSDPTESLRHEMAVRKLALDLFGEKLIAVGEPMSELEKSFVPIYLHHRYQVDATAKMVGGVEYYYAVRGDGQEVHRSIPVSQQKEALDVLLETIDPQFLLVPEKIRKLIPPKPFSSPSDRERFSSKTSPIFDIETAVEAAANLTLSNLLQPQRLARVNDLNDKQWNLKKIGDLISNKVFVQANKEQLELQRVQRVVQKVFVDRMIRLAASESISIDVSAWANDELSSLRNRLREKSWSSIQDSHNANLAGKISRHLERSAPEAKTAQPQELPPGSPIGN